MPLSKSSNSYLRYSSMAAEMIATIGIGAFIGWQADRFFTTTKPYFAAFFSLVFVGVALYRVIKTALQKEEQQTKP